MKREEFENVLKRALELQSLQGTHGEDPLSEEDLANAALRLKIPTEILQQALREERQSRKQFRLKGTPEMVREAFLRNFLLQDSNVPRGGHILPPVRVDRQALQIGRSTTVRVYHPQFSEIDAEVAFSADGPGHTLVSWIGHQQLGWKANSFAALTPFIVLISMIGPLIAGGAPLAVICSLLIIPLFLFYIMKTAIGKQARRVDIVLTEYFESIQILGDLKEQEDTRKELAELRALKNSPPQNSAHSGPLSQTARPPQTLADPTPESQIPSPPPPQGQREH